MSEKAFPECTPGKVEAVLEKCRRPGRILILIQDMPDPDALACADALRYLIHERAGKRAAIGYGGICGRAENRAMMDVLRIPARHITVQTLDSYKILCLVDTQPRSGNNLLTSSREADVVLDHHLMPKRKKWTAGFADVHPEYGATSTLLYEYLLAAGLPISPNMATALFYGIQSDTQDLGRESSPADVRAYRDLFLIADKAKLARIHHAKVPPDYFRMLADGLASSVVAGTTVVSYIPSCCNPDMIPELADRLMRLEGMRAAVCYGVCDGIVYLSARGRDARTNAAKRMKHVVARLGTGGGHNTMAGGQIPMDGDPEKRLALIHSRILKTFAPRKQPIPLTDNLPAGPCPYVSGKTGIQYNPAPKKK
jgi:nanoRNase/pAp phosphatase (c-di-AMP/oligoRNAs hydrolase)